MALSRHHGAAARPLNVQEVVAQAQDFEFTTTRPLKGWFRSAQMLLTEAAMCEQDGDLQLAYLYLYRHAELVLGKLAQHPEHNNPQFKRDFVQARKSVQANLAKLEQWKPRINRQYQRYVLAMEKRNADKDRIQEERRLDHEERKAWGDGTMDLHEDFNEVLNASENRELAVDIAHRELRRRGANREPRSPAEDSLRDSIRATGQHLSQYPDRHEQTNMSTDREAAASYRYPAVPARESSIDWHTSTQPQVPSHLTPLSPPLLPPKGSDPGHRQGHGRLATQGAPPVPEKEKAATRTTFKPAAFTESGSPLRTVMLPPELRTTFLNLADANTARNLETCAILCGTLISNALFISHLIVPDQHSTSDTCDTTEAGDNALFDYCDEHNLLVCGWIHTHPTQTCFLSSRDLHTSSGYQVMLPEAIAIVCAPRHNPDWGIFRLTDPPGLPALLKCQQQGLFHPHAEQHLYTDALRPGHVLEGPGLKFEVVDLRK